MVYRPEHDEPLTLFVRERDNDAEIWSGRRVGPDGARERFGADAAHPLAELDAKLPTLLDGATRIITSIGRYPSFERRIHRALEALHKRNRYGAAPPTVLVDARAVVGEDRMVKDEAAMQSLRRAVDITVAGHLEAMATLRPGMHEFEVEAIVESAFRRRGAGGSGYGSIVGAGANATVLHYVDNDGLIRDGDLVLLDAGAEWDLFTGDLTRTFPASGRFAPAQAELYDVVLRANEAAIAKVFPGSNVDAIHRTAVEHLVEGLLDLGLLTGERDRILEEESYKRYYMHRTSHWLGADVHDVGWYCADGQPRPLAPGYVLTVEPGLYVAHDDEQAPPAFRGLGIRIEDDVLVTERGPEVLTASAPKTRAALEALIGSVPYSGSLRHFGR